ncbi:MAG: WGR domain-containing protein [Candidatus Thorarchaeota archaeon]
MSLKEGNGTGRYEFNDKHEHKFWEGDIKGKSVTFHFGKIGTPGLKASREFTTVEAAKKFLEKRLKLKIEEGYKLVVTDSTP